MILLVIWMAKFSLICISQICICDRQADGQQETGKESLQGIFALPILSPLMDVQKAVTIDLDLISTLQIYALNVFEPMFIFSMAFLL